MRWSRIYFIFFVQFAFAALQNVTVDDAVLIGAVVPQYLPSSSAWNIGNNCSGCLVKPDASKAYDGTWHDATYHPGTGVAQSIEFTFTGSAVYIYFILANTVPNATTLTDLNFFMDGVSVGSFIHSPTSSTNYQYNVPVYVNESVPSGQHDISIYPVNTGNSVLMLLDYLVYTIDTDSVATSSSPPESTSAASVHDITATATTTTTATATALVMTSTGSSSSQPISTTSSPSPSRTQGAASGRKNTTMIGGVVGGVALALLVALLLCYWRHKRRHATGSPIRSQEGGILSSPGSPVPPASAPPSPVPFEGTPTQVSESLTRSKTMTLRLPNPQTSTSPPSTTSFSDHTGLAEQVELLRDEVSRLQTYHSYSQHFSDSEPKPPPPMYES